MRDVSGNNFKTTNQQSVSTPLRVLADRFQLDTLDTNVLQSNNV